MTNERRAQIRTFTKSMVAATEVVLKLQRIGFAPVEAWDRLTAWSIEEIPSSESERGDPITLFLDRNFVRRTIVFSWGHNVHISIEVERIKPFDSWGAGFASDAEKHRIIEALRWQPVKIEVKRNLVPTTINLIFDGMNNCQAVLCLADGKRMFETINRHPSEEDVKTLNEDD